MPKKKHSKQETEMGETKHQEGMTDGNVCSKILSQDSKEDLIKSGTEHQDSSAEKNQESILKDKSAPPKPPPRQKRKVPKEDSMKFQDNVTETDGNQNLEELKEIP